MEPTEEHKHRYFVLNKPYSMVSQFVSPDAVRLLSHLPFDFPEGTHAIGRLDNLSEGLLLLTTNKRVTRLLFQSAVPHKRTYLVQVLYKVNEDTLQQLRNGILLPGRRTADFVTAPCEVDIIEQPEWLDTFPVPLSGRVPYTWLRMTLTEGKYHQVRKMVASVRHRCIRLIRVAIEDMEITGIPPGAIAEVDEETFFSKLKIDDWK